MLKHLRLSIVFIFVASMAYTPLTLALTVDEQEVVRQNCVLVQGLLQQRTQPSDAANRVKRGQVYETLLSKYMTPLNARVASNGLSSEAAKLTEITGHYQQSLDNFKNKYDTYADTVDEAVRMRCKNKPQEFYDKIQTARQQRGEITTSIVTLDQLIEEYRVAVGQMKRSI